MLRKIVYSLGALAVLALAVGAGLPVMQQL